MVSVETPNLWAASAMVSSSTSSCPRVCIGIPYLFAEANAPVEGASFRQFPVFNLYGAALDTEALDGYVEKMVERSLNARGIAALEPFIYGIM
jgi:hypothetical protein